MASEVNVRPVAAVDFGGTHIRTAVVDPNGGITGFNYTETQGNRGPAAVIRRVVDSIAKSIASAGTRPELLAGVGVAAPGPLDYETGVVLSAPNIPGFENVDVAGPLRERFGLATFLGNDANLAALAEHTYGAGRGVGNMIYITVSTGVGGGILLDGELLLGASGNAGEVGHMTVDFNGEQHSCGNIGCVEAYASGTAMAQYAERELRSGRPSTLTQVLAKQGRVSGRDVVEAAAQRDELGTESLRRGVSALAAGLVSLIHVFDTELIVVGGGVANAGDLLFEPLRELVFQRLMKGFGKNLRIVPWTLGENVGILGAAAWARRRLHASPPAA